MSDSPPPVKQTAYIALGSNLASKHGAPEQILGAAMDRLAGLGQVRAQSSLYETDPVGFRDQPAFLNAVLALETQLNPTELWAQMLALERAFGRERHANMPKGPRTLDLDLLLVDDLTIASEGLTVPHPALAQRRFVLAPLAEIAPQLSHPLLGRTMAELLDLLPDEGENRLASVRRLARESSTTPETI